MQPQQETIFYQDTSPVFISSNRAVFFNNIYLTNGIVSVSTEEVKPNRGNELAIAFIGILLVIAACFGLISPHLTINAILGWAALFIFSIVLLLLGLFRYFNATPHYALVIGNPSGKSRVVISPDHDYINVLQNALNQALLNRIN